MARANIRIFPRSDTGHIGVETQDIQDNWQANQWTSLHANSLEAVMAER